MGLPVNLFNLLNKKVKEVAENSKQKVQEQTSKTKPQQVKSNSIIEQNAFEKAINKMTVYPSLILLHQY